MRSLCVITGYVGQKPVLRTSPSGKAVTSLSLAEHRTTQDGEGQFKDLTVWHHATAWGGLAERVVASLDKGMLIQARFRLDYRPGQVQDSDGVVRERPLLVLNLQGFDILHRRVRADGEAADAL